MAACTFFHISDIHYSHSYDAFANRLIARTGLDFTRQLEYGMAHIRQNYGLPDFFLLTGDLVHNGSEEEYGSLRSLLTELCGGAPVYAGPGNHDTDAYGPGFLQTESPPPFDREYTDPSSGLRILAMDSRGGAYESGFLCEDQLAWLSDRLADGGGKKTILALHHTPHISGEEEFLIHQMENPQSLFEVVKDSGLLAIFCGHTHKAFASRLGDIPCYTAGSITYGVDCGMESLVLSNETGFHRCLYENGQLTVEYISIPAPGEIKLEIPYFLRLLGMA